MTRNQKLKQIFSVVALIVFLVLLLRFVLLPTINSDQFRQFTESLGVFGYLVIIGYVVISHVFAPLAGTPVVALGVTIYGIQTGMWLFYVGSLISATINFAIARRFGRPWVTKFVGKQSMSQVDEFAAIEGKEVLIISRLLGFALFDFISYAAGLTTLSFKNYILITAVFSLIPNILMQFVFKDLNFRSEQGIMIWIGLVVTAGVIFGSLMRKYLRKRTKGQGAATV